MLAQTDVFFLQKPPRQSAHLPFGADVRTGSHDDIHAVFPGQTAERRHVIVAGEVELPLALLVDVPKHVEADGVHAEGLAHLDAVIPVLAWNARIVQLGRLDHKGLPVEQERAFAHGEVARLGCRRGRRRTQGQQCRQGKG